MGKVKTVEGVCEWCGEPFVTVSTGRRKRYCSKACSMAGWRRDNSEEFHNCAYCGKQFTGKKKKYCCDEHRKIANGQKRSYEFKYVFTKPPSITIERVCALARKEDLSYGQYVAKYGLK